MTNEEALQWLEDNQARKLDNENRYIAIETPSNGTKYIVVVNSRISANGSNLVEATEKCEKIKQLEDRKELVRQKYAARGLIK